MADQNLILYIKNEDGTAFHNLRLNKFAFTTTVMSLNSKIEGDFYYKDNTLSFTLAEYVEYKGVKYTLKNPPVIVKKGLTADNSELKGMTKYTCTFYHEEIELYNIPFTDVAIDSQEVSYRSEKRTFSWIGTITSLVAKINQCLRGTKWSAGLQPGFADDGTMSEVLSFSNQFISDACKVVYETYKVPFVIDGYKILFGKPSNEILGKDGQPYIFQLGQGVGLKNNDVTPKNNKVITRIAGTGSDQNLPYGYPIIKNAAGEVINHPYTRDRLMPSVYIRTLRDKLLVSSSTQLIDYYDADDTYPTPLNPLAPVFHIQEFNEIKPSIEGMTYLGNAIDSFKTIITPEGGWDDYINPETGEVRQSYFDVTLYPLGFDLYAQAAVTGAMTFSMKSGNTLGANFEVAVDWEDVKKNFYVTDEAGNVVFAPDGEQRDLSKYPKSTDESITIKLTKDLETFGTLIPNQWQYPVAGDKFVILHIEMPQEYIDAAQNRLDAAMKKYMLENNIPLFDYPLEFDEFFLTNNSDILNQIKANTIVRFKYGTEVMALSVKEMSIRYGSDKLPKYNITLTDEVSIVLNQIGQIADGLSKLGSQVASLQAIYGMDIYAELNKKLSRVTDDTTTGKITSTKGFQVGNFVTGSTGGIFNVDSLGKSHAELDFLTVRMKAYFYALEVIKTGVIGGRLMVTPGGAIDCTKVEEFDSYYRCYFLADDGTKKVENRFRQGDQAMSEDFNIQSGVYEDVSNHYYWRLVVNTGPDYIDLSKTDADVAHGFKSDVPKAGDTICQLGNRTDPTRQNALIMSAADTYSPSLTFYCGINNYSYLDKEYIEFGVDKTTNLAYMNVYGNSYTGARDRSSYFKSDVKTGVEVKGTFVTKSGKDVEETLNSFQDQIDGVKETFYGEYSPTLENYPANEWTTEKDKKRHEGDVFTNIQPYVDDKTTPDAGKSWRWVQVDGVWGWTQIADSDTSKAYYEAAQAKKAAEEARTSANQANTTVNSLKDFTDEAFKDGIVDRSEAVAIQKYLNTIASIQKDVTESYSKVYVNALLEGPAKTDLKTAYDGFNTATTDLISTINSAITDGVTTDVEIAAVDGKYNTFNTKYGDFIGYLNAANKFIQDKINDNAANALKAAEQAQKAAEAAAAGVTALSGTVDSLKNFTDDAFKDGVIDRGEAVAIEKYINSVNATKSEAEATYNKLYANEYLLGTAKTGLKTAFDSLNASVTALLAAINTAIADDIATPEEKVNVDAKFADYSKKLGAFGTALETANKSIQDTLKGYSDTALEAAKNAQTAADDAKTRLNNWAADGVISPTEKQGIKDEIARIDADKDNISVGYTLYSLGTPTAYNSAYTTYRAVLVTLSAATPEVITIPSDFASKQTTYYTQRTTALNAIATATKNQISALDKEIGGYEYLKRAWRENTTIEGGVIQNSLNMLGYTDASKVFHIMSGMNGIYNSGKTGGGIASWYGGAMKDRADYTAATMPDDVAKAVIRMDGSGYLANGAVWWGLDGKFHADPLSFLIEEEQLGDYVRLFQIVYTAADKKNIRYMVPQYPMQKLTVSEYIEIGTTGYRIGVDTATKALKVYASDGTAVGLYATGFVSAMGAQSGGGSGGGGLISSVYRYSNLGGTFNDTDTNNTFNAYTINMLANRIKALEAGGGGGTGIAGIKVNGSTYVPDADKYITIPNYPTALTWAAITDKPSWIGATKPAYAFSEITGKPTTLAGYGITDGLRALSVSGTGDAIVGGSASGTGITLTKGNISKLTGVYYVINSATAADAIGNWAAGVYGAHSTTAYGSISANSILLNVSVNTQKMMQIANTAGTDDFFMRGSNNSSFRTWYKLLHTGNFAGTMDGRYVTIETSQNITGGKAFTATLVSTNNPLERRMKVDTSNYEMGLIFANKNGSTRIAEIGYHNTAKRLFIIPQNVASGYDDKVGNYALKIGVNELTYNTGHIWYSGNSNKNDVNWVCRNSYVERGVIARNMRFNNFLAYYDSYSTNVVTGTICITLPNTWSNSMNVYEIILYEYNDKNCSTINIGAYNFSSSASAWHQHKYNTKGYYNNSVRLAYNGSKCVILLGNTTTTWIYPKVFLRTVYTGHNATTSWDDGYTITVITNESGYTNVASPGRSNEYFGNTSVSGLTVNGGSTFNGHLLPGTNASFNIGSETQKWATVYTNGGLQVQKSSYGPGSIELYMTTPFIDFHFNNSTADYTSRIIEVSSGRLAFTHQLQVNNDAYFGGTTNWYFNKYGDIRSRVINSVPYSDNNNVAWSTAMAADALQSRMIGANGSFAYEVILLLPAPATTNLSGYNKIQGRFMFYTNGANQTGWVDIILTSIYNATRYNLTQGGQRTSFCTLATCMYGGIRYYCLKIPYAANRWDQTYFYGTCYSTLPGGISTRMLPVLLKYKTAANGSNAEVINIPEINNSLSDTLNIGGVTSTTTMLNITSYGIAPMHNGTYDLGGGSNRWKYLYANNIDITGTVSASGYYGSLLSQAPQLAGSYENNEINVVTNNGSSKLNHSIRFRWYNNYYQIGIVRGGSTDALGFSICNNTTEVLRVGASAITAFQSIDSYGAIHGRNVIYAGEGADNSYGWINVCRTASINNAACFSWVRAGTMAFALGFNTSNQIVMGGGLNNRTVNSWITIGASGTYVVGYLYASGAITAMQTSDYALKHNFDGTIDYRSKLLRLGRVYDYNYNDKALMLYEGTLDKKRHTGLIYQNAKMAGITGFCHDLDKNGYGGLNYLSPDLMATVIGAVQANILSIRMVETEQERIRKELAKAKAEIEELKLELARRGS